MATVANVKVEDGKVTPLEVTATLTAPAACADVTHSIEEGDSDVTLHATPSTVTEEVVALNP